MSVRFERVTRAFDGEAVIDDLDLEVPSGSFTVVTGPPKSGKSVLFRLLVGLETLDAGRILLEGEDIGGTPAPARRVGYVPQSFALYPHMSVARNIGYPMALARASSADIAARVDWAASMLAIGHLLDKTPDQLSGGEKQRVAVARGLLKEARVFVFDDPLVGLDYKLRERLMDDLRTLREELGATFLYGTSDSVEALTLASRLVVLDGGRIVQEGATEQVYDDPAHVRAMALVGFPRANLLEGRAEGGALHAGPLTLPLPTRRGAPDDTAEGGVTVGFRPESLRLGDAGFGATASSSAASSAAASSSSSSAAPAPAPAPASASASASASAATSTAGLVLDAVVHLVEDLGGEIVVYVDVDGTTLTSVFAAGERAPPILGERVTLRLDAGDVHLFDARGAALGRAATTATAAATPGPATARSARSAR